LQPRFLLEQTAILRYSFRVFTDRIPELKTLTPEEKLVLVGELWEELASTPESLPVRPDHLAILKDRVEQLRQNPESTVAWEEVKARILSAR
jgi:putative addiction module component (TIGR02574 family)